MQYRKRKFQNCLSPWHGLRPCRGGLTIIELIIALAIITIIFAAVLPQFRVIQNGWDSRQANTEVLQNGRILIDHIARNLSKAVKIIDVSESTEPDGFVVFQDNDGNNLRYDVNDNNYVEFGLVGSLFDLAGPVSSFKFTCYDANDLDNPLSPITDVNIIRAIRVDATIINSGLLVQDKTFTGWAYLRTNSQGGSDCWQNEDIGDVGAAGSAAESDGTWTINASGADIWNTTDEFHFVYQSLSGDGQIIARVVSVENTNSWAKAGVMIRETLDGDSAHAMMVVTPGNGTAFQRRTTTGGSSDHTAGSAVTAPYWVKLVRSGNTFTGYESPDGSTWTQVDSVSITMAADVYIGLAVTSHSDGDICTAEIDTVGFSTVTYEGCTEAKVDSDDTSITIPTIGSVVGTLGSWVDGLTHTAETGSNRALIFTAHVEEAGNINLSSVTYGGQTMTKVIDQIVTSGGFYAYVAGFILDEDGIAAATSDTFVPTWSTTPDNVDYGSVFLQSVDQSDPIGASASNTTTSSNDLQTTSLSTNDGDMVILAATCGNAGDYTVNNSFTEAIELDMASSTGVDGYKTADGSNETPSVTHSGANRQVLIGFVVQVSGEISGIEGDLLIAAVATDGDTSSSLAPPVGENWNEIDVNDYSNAVTLGVWWKLAEDPESTSHEFTWSGGQQAYGWMMHFTGHNADSPINCYSAGGATSSTPTSPGVTTTVNNCLILRLGAFDNDNITEGDTGLAGHTTITMTDSGGGDVILFQDDFEGGNFNKWTDGGSTDWNLNTAQYVSYNHSAHASRWEDDDLISDDIDLSAYSYFTITFSYRDHGIDWNDYVQLELYNGSTYVYRASLQNTTPEDNWNPYSVTIYNSGADSQYFINNFRIKFEATDIDNNEDLWIDDVTITVPNSGIVSGGAGYIGQASSSDSGTSTFVLTSSNASQMLTIAIAPADTGSCEGTIQP